MDIRRECETNKKFLFIVDTQFLMCNNRKWSLFQMRKVYIRVCLTWTDDKTFQIQSYSQRYRCVNKKEVSILRYAPLQGANKGITERWAFSCFIVYALPQTFVFSLSHRLMLLDQIMSNKINGSMIVSFWDGTKWITF